MIINQADKRQMIKISFVEGPLSKVTSREELLGMLDKTQNDKELSNLDLSAVELHNIDFSGYKLSNIVFNAFNPERKERKKLFNVDFEGCQLCQVSFAHCRFERCNFDSIPDVMNTMMGKVDFFFSRFDYSRFKNVKMNICDFRYSEIDNCSMGGVEADLCDFYMASFKGVSNFVDSHFKRCSFTNTFFENHCITMANLHSLVQEDYNAYADIIINMKNWHKINPCAGESFLNKSEQEKKKIKNGEACETAEKNIEVLTLESMCKSAKEAQLFYTMLSGIYNGKGLNHDSNEAYRRAKVCEKNYYWRSIKVFWATRQYWRIFPVSIKNANPTKFNVVRLRIYDASNFPYFSFPSRRFCFLRLFLYSRIIRELRRGFSDKRTQYAQSMELQVPY